MATRQMAWKDWLKRVLKAPLADQTSDFIGYPVDAVSERLGVSRQRVHQLIEAERLDTIEILTTKGAVCMTLVTEKSLEKYVPAPVGTNRYTSQRA